MKFEAPKLIRDGSRHPFRMADTGQPYGEFQVGSGGSGRWFWWSICPSDGAKGGPFRTARAAYQDACRC